MYRKLLVCSVIFISLALVSESWATEPIVNLPPEEQKGTIPSRSLEDITIGPGSVIYLASRKGVTESEGRIYKSTDRSVTWQSPKTLPKNQAILSLAADPKTPGVLYVGTIRDGIFKSTDDGNSWSQVNEGLRRGDRCVTALAIDPKTPSTIYAAVGYGDIGGNLYKTENAGDKWTHIWNVYSSRLAGPDNLFDAFTIAIDPQTPTTLYAGCREGKILKSNDGGRKWTILDLGISGESGSVSKCVHAVAVVPGVPETIFASDSFTENLYVSSNGGESWKTRPLIDDFVKRLIFDPDKPSIVYVLTHFTIMKSVDGGKSWRAAERIP